MYAGGRLNIKMSSYQYRDQHVKDKTVSRPSKRSRDRQIFNMGILIPGKDDLYIESGPRPKYLEIIEAMVSCIHEILM